MGNQQAKNHTSQPQSKVAVKGKGLGVIEQWVTKH